MPNDDMLSPITNVPGEILESFDSEDFIRAWQDTLSMDIRPELNGVEQFHLCRCPLSQYQYFYPTNLAGGPLLYKQLETFNWYYGEGKWEHRVVQEAIADIKGPARLLEIGSARGAFLRDVPDNFETIGLETNPTASQTARDKGFNVISETLETYAESQPEKFDVICSFQVLEHIPDPLPFLKTCVDLLKPGGRLYLSTPDGHGFHAAIPPLKHILDAPPHHVGRWSVAAFEYLCRILPLETNLVRFEPMQEHHLKWYMLNLFSAEKPADVSGLKKAWRRLLVKLLYKHVRKHKLYTRWKGHTILVGYQRRADD